MYRELWPSMYRDRYSALPAFLSEIWPNMYRDSVWPMRSKNILDTLGRVMQQGAHVHAQFVEVPPIEDVKEFFTAVTGRNFNLLVTWTKWLPIDTDQLYAFRPYIRRCHQKLLKETANGTQKNPCSLLRQLLRPHGYCISLVKKTYTLIEWKEDTKTVGVKEGGLIVWQQ